MYEIRIKGLKEPIIVPDDTGIKVKAMFSDDKKYPDTQKMGFKDWLGTKGEIKSVFHLKEESNAFSINEDIQFIDSDLRIFWETILPFTEKRPIPMTDDGSMFDYLTREGEVLFLETHNVLRIEDRTKILQYRITNPMGFLGLRDKINQVHRMHGRIENAEKKRLLQLEEMAENIGILPS